MPCLVVRARPRIPTAAWGLVALGAGMALGSVWPAQLAPVANAVRWLFAGLSFLAPYIIFFTIGAAVIDMLRGGHAGRFAAAVAGAFTILGVLASLLAIVLVVPMMRLPWTGGGAARTLLGGGLTFGEIVRAHVTPSLTAVLYAIAVTWILHRASRWRWAQPYARPTLDVVRRVGVDGIALVGRAIRVAFPVLLLGIGIFIPTAIGNAIQRTQAGLASAGPQLDSIVGTNAVALYLLTVGMQVVILFAFFGLVTLLVCWRTKFSVKRFVKEYLLYVYPFAWATSSSAASIPINLERTEALGVRKEVREFVVPLGATVNLDGAIIAVFVITPMASLLVGYTPSFTDLLLLVIPVKLVTLGVPGIPGGIATVVPPVVADVLPIPPEARASFLAIWFGFSVGLSDQFRTGVNTATNGLVAMLFEHWYPRWFERKAEAPPAASPADATEDVPT